MSLHEHLLRTAIDPTPITELSAWWERHLAIGTRFPRSIDHAIAAGLEADRLGWAFASGYRAALGALVPTLAPDAMAALCVTEDAGNTPRAVATRLVAREDGSFVLTGDKRWTTLGPRASALLVAARVDAEDAARPELRVVVVDARAAGITITPMADAPFVPEIPHASVSFRDVRVGPDAVLPGDGYDRYVKPFRTVEDVHVFGAALGHAIRELRRADGTRSHRASLEDALSVVSCLRSLAEEDPSSAATHLVLAGAISGGRRVLALLDPILAGDDEPSVRWRRDRPLLSVAGSARAKRLERAWSVMSS